MPYSSIQLPNIPSTKIVDQDTYIYIAPPNHPRGKTGSTSSWSGATFGSDSSGDGSLARPYATLRAAWEAAQGLIVQGNGRIIIQFQKGIYGYTFDPNNRSTNPFPENLYHPQGERIIIQGDPEAIEQRYLYRVKNYTWDLSRAPYFGHTGTVNLWYAQHAHGITHPSYPNGAGYLTHGFTAEDVYGYVAITNAAQSTIYGRPYIDTYNGVNSQFKYTVSSNVSAPGSGLHNWMRASLNHGLSYEEANAVCGLARIEGATSSPTDLVLQFKNYNLDGRILGYPIGSAAVPGGSLGGGLNNAVYAVGSGVVGPLQGNYPEPQYGVPIGYYGPTYGVLITGATINPGNEGAPGFGSGSGINLTYPARNASEVHITDDAHVLTTYPVVIKVYASSSIYPYGNRQRPTPIYMDGCKIGSIRNLMFVNGDLEAISRTIGPQGATLAPCNLLDTDSELDSTLGASVRGRSPSCMIVTNGSETKVRHLGMIGWGNDIANAQVCSLVVSSGSRLTTDTGVEISDHYTNYSGSNSGNTVTYAELGRLSNTPVLMIDGGGIQNSGASLVDFTDGFKSIDPSRLAKTPVFSQSPVFVHKSLGNGGSFNVNGAGTIADIGSTTIITNSPHLPGKYSISMNFPVIPGATVFGGVTSTPLHPTVFMNSQGRGVSYTSILGFLVRGGTRVPFGRFCGIVERGTTFPNSTGTGRTGWGNANVLWSAVSGSGTAVNLPTGFSAAVQNQPMTLHGIQFSSEVLQSAHPLDTAIALRHFINAGNTLEFVVYHDQDESVAGSNYIAFNKNGVVIRTPSGVTITGGDSGGGNTGWGFTLAFAGTRGTEYNYGYDESETVSLYDYASSNVGLQVYDQASAFHCGTLKISGKSYLPLYLTNDSQFFGRGSYVSVCDHSHSGILVQSGSRLQMFSGAVVIKNPYVFGIRALAGGEYNIGLNIRFGGSARIEVPTVVVGTPYARYFVLNQGPTGSSPVNKAGIMTRVDRAEPTNIYAMTSGGFQEMTTVVQMTNNAKLQLIPGYSCLVAGYDGGIDAYNGYNAGTCGMMGSIDDCSELWGCDALMHFWNTNQPGNVVVGSAGSGTIKMMTRGRYGVCAANGDQLLYNAPIGASMWFMGIGRKDVGTSGWIGPRATIGLPTSSPGTPGAQTNLGWLDTIKFVTPPAGRQSYGVAVRTTLAPQLASLAAPSIPSAANYDAANGTPGFSGPGFRVSSEVKVCHPTLG